MKKCMMICGVILLLVTGLFAYKTKTTTSISGKITPGDGAEMVWAISGNDTARTTPVPVMGSFSVQVQPGTYTIIVIAKAPYKNAQVDNVMVSLDQAVNVGEITLSP